MREIFTLNIREGLTKQYDPLVVSAKLKESIPDMAALRDRWVENGAYSDLKTLMVGLANAFQLVPWSEESPEGLLAKEYLDVWNEWCRWCADVKKNTNARPGSSQPTTRTRRPAPTAS